MELDWLEQHMSEFAARPASTALVRSVVDPPRDQSSAVHAAASAAAALDLVSEAATAVRIAEERGAEMVARAEHLANAAIEKLRLAEAHIERAERAQRQAEAELAKVTSAAAEARNDLDMAQTRLAATESELAAAEQRASLAEAAVERIVDAIRTQFPVASARADKDAAERTHQKISELEVRGFQNREARGKVRDAHLFPPEEGKLKAKPDREPAASEAARAFSELARLRSSLIAGEE